ncbi:hypothetical protein FRB96_009122 [Tulasnella sp. 330]|nr:hypothetical protein FRB96_009122 [Tulasnella sp. 330]KAG8875935.1 hypothetical protein FRB97_004612 [Tulasnella sp. 331]
MAIIGFAMKRTGSGRNLERWLRFWIFALAIKIVEVVIPMRMIYWIVKYFVIVSLATTWSPDLLPTASRAMQWVINEGPRLSNRVRTDVANVLDGLRDGVENYAAGAPISINTPSSPATTTSSATGTAPTTRMNIATPFQIQPYMPDNTGVLAAVETRRRQLEAELVALATIQEGASMGARLPEVPVD